MPNLLQNLGFLQGLKFLKKRMNFIKRSPTVDFWRSSVFSFSNKDSFFLFSLHKRHKSQYYCITVVPPTPDEKDTNSYTQNNFVEITVVVEYSRNVSWISRYRGLKKIMKVGKYDQEDKNCFRVLDNNHISACHHKAVYKVI